MYRISVRRGEHYLGYKTITKTCEAEASREIKRREKIYIYGTKQNKGKEREGKNFRVKLQALFFFTSFAFVLKNQ